MRSISSQRRTRRTTGATWCTATVSTRAWSTFAAGFCSPRPSTSGTRATRCSRSLASDLPMRVERRKSGADGLHVRAALLAMIAFALLFGGGSADALRHPGAPRCSVFPKTSPWNQRVDRLPVAANSDAIVASIGVDDHVHADFGSRLWDGGPIGIPVTVVGGGQKKTRVSFEYADESDRGPYPIPRN